MNGTEPTSSSDAAPHFIAAVGTLKLGPSSGIGGTCQITGGELLYNDEDQLTMFGGPAGCYAANGGLLGNPGVPCFNGSTTISGALANNVGLSGGVDGGATLNMVVAFPFSLPGGGAAPDLPLSFHIQSNYGAWVVGNSVSDGGPTPANPPPGSPVLTLTMQEQSSTVSLPVTGPAAPGQGFGNGNPFAPFMLAAPLCGAGQGCTTNGIGVAPYLGLTVSSASGFGSLSGDPTAGLLAALEGTPTATFGTTTGATQFFANGLAGGSVSFDDNDDVGNTTGATNNDCDVGITATGNFADGSSNLGAWGQHPSLSCSDAAAGFSFYLGSVAWGPTDTNGFYIVEGIAAVSGAPLAPTGSTGILPPGDQSTAVDLASVPAGALYPLVSSTLISVKSSAPYTGYVSFFSTTPAGCDVTASMANSKRGRLLAHYGAGYPLQLRG